VAARIADPEGARLSISWCRAQGPAVLPAIRPRDPIQIDVVDLELVVDRVRQPILPALLVRVRGASSG
jgi:hypothetical protein